MDNAVAIRMKRDSYEGKTRKIYICWLNGSYCNYLIMVRVIYITSYNLQIYILVTLIQNYLCHCLIRQVFWYAVYE